MRGTWVAQLVKHLTLGFDSGHDLTVQEWKPCIGLCANSVDPAWDSLSPSAPHTACALSVFLSQNK